MKIRRLVKNTFKKELKEITIYKWIDLWKGQLNGDRKSYPPSFPAAYIHISDIDYTDRTVQLQEGEVSVSVYLFFHQGTDSFVGAADEAKEDDILNIVEQTANTLQWVQEDTFPDGFTLIHDKDLSDQYRRPAYKLTFQAVVRTAIDNKYNYVY
ncbi:hypothetical protein HN014_08075 [Aquimarina sp. TRL1]|uniref:hypothetical protein n=1 Tax=Aquimarina sp. (strain TRL1) TaxID=2736252 RepID=UPI00158CDDFF|nr:hypothetical protein [Aquimarina sp. TRL1]QKX04875.1 hypothetical protein HN014_08075 [Aquimarina sp. TRL1]